jgi:hypothetical protein
MFLIIPTKESLRKGVAVLKCTRSSPGNSGRYFMVRNWLSSSNLSGHLYAGMLLWNRHLRGHRVSHVRLRTLFATSGCV